MGVVVYTGRPCRTRRTEYNEDWEYNRKDEMKELTNKGVVPWVRDRKEKGAEFLVKEMPMLMGECCAAVDDIKPAKEIVDEMVATAVQVLKKNASLVARL